MNKKISLWQIYEITRKFMSEHNNITSPSLEEILETDKIVRTEVKKMFV